MSDILKTGANSIPSFIWTAGEQPDATKFRVLFGSFTNSINLISSILGPIYNQNVYSSTKDRVISSNSFFSKMDSNEKEDFLSIADDTSTILNTFNLARIIGPHAILNPLYIPGSEHSKESQANGCPLKTNTQVQQLPFPPQDGYTWTIIDADENVWTKVSSKEAVSAAPDGVPNGYAFYIDKSGTLYSSEAFPINSYIKYDLIVPNTFGYLKSGYNCIPDLSILSVEDSDILSRTGDGTHGRCVVSYVSTGANYSKWLVKLPQIVSSKDPLLNFASKGIDNNTFEPIGKYSVDDDKKYYVLNDDIYLAGAEGGPTFIDNNLISLFNSANGQTYALDWERASDISEDVARSFYVSGPLALKDIFLNDDNSLLSAGGVNSRHFYLFCLGSNISETLAQNTLNFARHTHDGYDSYRIHHNDLLGVEGELQGIGTRDGSDGGLNFRDYYRQLSFSAAPDNVHPQYMHRLGLMYGGSQGLYKTNVGALQYVDLNAFHGDFLFYPLENVPTSYKYVDFVAYDEAETALETDETITWDLDKKTNISAFPNLRTHALIFGWPKFGIGLGAGKADGQHKDGGTKLYYEPWNFITDTEYDNRGIKWTLSRHGFIPGDETGLTGNALSRGLNIGWGNLFFGYREDIFGGLLTGNYDGNAVPAGQSTEASAYWRVGEFNVVTTSNNKSGANTNSAIKEDYTYRDGFAVRAVKGSNIWLSAGSESLLESKGLNENGKATTIALEASTPAWYDSENSGKGGLKTIIALSDRSSSGSGVFLAPGMNVNTSTLEKSIPWAAPGDFVYTVNGIWNGLLVDQPVNNSINGSLLDIFALAYDYNYGTNDDNPVIGQDSSLTGWAYGRPYVRGTYGVNFCVSSSTENLDPDFELGWTLWNFNNRSYSDIPVPGGANGKVNVSVINGQYSASLQAQGSGYTAGTKYISGLLLDGASVVNDLELTITVSSGQISAITNVSGEPRTRAWGASYIDLQNFTGETKEYIHREFRFWGKQNNDDFSASANTAGNSVGGNINLLYNFGRNYKRHGRDLPWSNENLHGLPKYPNPLTSIWANSKAISLGSIRPEVYGSAIRQASFVEAFEGFRSDPLQPYIAEYVMPFKVLIPTESGDNFIVDFHNRNIIITDTDMEVITGKAYYSKKRPTSGASIDTNNLWVNFSENYSLTNNGKPGIDALVRGAEEIFLENSNTVNIDGNLFPRCLIDYSMDLQYFTGINIDEEAETNLAGTYGIPHSGTGLTWTYDLIKNGQARMVNVSQLYVNGSTSYHLENTIPIIRPGKENGNGWILDDSILGAQICYQFAGYNSYLVYPTVEKSIVPSISDYPLFSSIYTSANTNVFGVLLNIPTPEAGPAGFNTYMPYRVYRSVTYGSTVEISPTAIVPSPGIAVELSGVIKIKVRRARSGHGY